MNVLDKVQGEKSQIFAYPDERIASNIYYISLSHALGSLAGMKEDEREQKAPKNEWLRKESLKIQTVPVLAFDNITKELSNEMKSCDGLFYNFALQEGEHHYLAEFKNTGKKELLSQLKSEDNDGMYYKVRDSVQLIKNELAFGGTQEKEELIKHMHFFVVYEGKNNVAVQTTIKLPGRVGVNRDIRNKQKRAGRMDYSTEKVESEIYTQFGRKILDLGLQECNENTFPGKALPRAGKAGKGKGKVRAFSIFSAQNFAEIVEKGFFDEWNWGEYLDSFVPVNTEQTTKD